MEEQAINRWKTQNTCKLQGKDQNKLADSDFRLTDTATTWQPSVSRSLNLIL